MKVIVEEKEKGIKFPCLMKDTDDLIVLFSKDGVGVVIYGNWGIYPIGYYSNSWDMDNFEPFTDRLILEN